MTKTQTGHSLSPEVGDLIRREDSSIVEVLEVRTDRLLCRIPRGSELRKMDALHSM